MSCELDVVRGRPCDLPGMCREHESVVVVCPAAFPSGRMEGEESARIRVGCASRLLRGRDRRGRCRQVGWPDRDSGRVAGAVCRESGGQRCGRVGGDDRCGQDRRAAASAGDPGGGRQHPQAQLDHGGEGEDGPARRQDAGAVAGLGPARRSVDAGRADADDAPADESARAARTRTHAREERGARRAGAQPLRAAAGHRRVREGRAPLAGAAGAARRRAVDARRLPAPGRLPRRRDRRARGRDRRRRSLGRTCCGS
jgi:hypothetical protein